MPHIREDRYTGYDLVGDVHGCADSLNSLLDELGYVKRKGVYEYKDQRKPRQLIFLGDILDRGPKIREAMLLIRELVDRGSAEIVMGNHEYNALAYTTRAPEESGKRYLREHTARHEKGIRETLDQFANYTADWLDTLDWLYEWPLLIEHNGFRVIHACWDHTLVAQFLQRKPDACIDSEFLAETVDYKNFASQCMSRITRGASLHLPDKLSMTASDGYIRTAFRIKFWIKNPLTYGDIQFQPDKLEQSIADRLLSEEEKSKIPYYGPEQKPLFIGHYWQQGTVKPVVKNIACLDYSAVKNGKLVAYRMSPETALSADNFVWVNARETISL